MPFLEGILYMLWRGIAIGIIISAPMGPVGILCVQRTLEKGRSAGFFTGVGAAISDLFYCLLTGFGLSFIEEFLNQNQNVIQIIGSAVLIVFGIYLFKSNPARSIKKPGENQISRKRNILNGFIFTVSNPLIIFLIIGLFARFNFMMPEIQFYHYILGFGCIFAGALAWWWFVSLFIDKVRAHFNLRSMWLVNKITGSIIMIFGVVGIVTASIALAQAADNNALYLNSRRGFHPMIADNGKMALIDGNSSSAIKPLRLDGQCFTLDFRARNLHNGAGSRYPAVRPDGKTAKVSHPAWNITFADSGGDTLTFSIATHDNIIDPMATTVTRVAVTYGDSLLYNADVAEGLDHFTGWNAWKVSRDAEGWHLEAGNREYTPLLDIDIPDFAPSQLSFNALPGALLEIDWLTLHTTDTSNSDTAYMANPDVLHSYLQRSTDPMEGIWEMFDRSLDEDLARPGGNYRLALIRNGNGYDMIYLDGAQKNPDLWKPGMLKGRLIETSFRNIFDVLWYDVNVRPVDTEIKAEFTSPGTLALQLPYFSSSMRLRRITSPWKQHVSR